MFSMSKEEEKEENVRQKLEKKRGERNSASTHEGKGRKKL